MRVALDLVQRRQIVRVRVEHDAFGNHRHAVAPSVAQTLDDGADQRVDDRLQPERLRELFGNQRERRAGGLADPEREMTGLCVPS